MTNSFLTYKEIQELIALRQFVDSENGVNKDRFVTVTVPAEVYAKLFDEYLRLRQIISRNLY